MIVAHLDLDAFYAAVEELENPELRTQPLVVGGDPRGRGVVATANYVARRFGIHSAMSCAEALRRCPQAVFVRPRHTLYREYSRSVWETVRGVVPTVEQTGWTRAISTSEKSRRDFLAARAVAEAVRTAVRAGTSLTCSLGVAPCKVVAKVASDARKPGGLVVVPSGKEAAFLAPLAVRRLPGVGPKAEERLRARRHRDDRRPRRARRTTIFAASCRAASGRCSATVPAASTRASSSSTSERISISVENTFERDIADRERLHDELRGMAAEVAEALQRSGQVARTVTTKLRYADFSIRSRSTSLAPGSTSADTIADLACRLLDRGLRDRPGALRLVGVGVSGLADFRQLSLEELSAPEMSRSGSRLSSRGGGTRTPDLRFWRPPLYQLSYAPVSVGQCTARRARGAMSELTEEPEGFENSPRTTSS